MINLIPLFFVLMFVAYGVLVIVYLVLVWRFFSLLKMSHPIVYARLGSPHLILNNTPATTWPLLSFLFKREYESECGHNVIAQAKILRLLLFVGVGMFSGILVMFYLIVTHGHIASLK